ncbi:MAG: hypothetical protein ACPG2Y_01505, partial [Acholeplasmataceae bacterium]
MEKDKKLDQMEVKQSIEDMSDSDDSYQSSSSRNERINIIKASPEAAYYVPPKQPRICMLRLRVTSKQVENNKQTKSVSKQSQNWSIKDSKQEKLVTVSTQNVWPYTPTIDETNHIAKFEERCYTSTKKIKSKKKRINWAPKSLVKSKSTARTIVSPTIETPKIKRKLKWDSPTICKETKVNPTDRDNMKGNGIKELITTVDRPKICVIRKMEKGHMIDANQKIIKETWKSKRQRWNPVFKEYASKAFTNTDCGVVFDRHGRLKYHQCHNCTHNCKGIHCNKQHKFTFVTYDKMLTFTARCQPKRRTGPENWVYKFKKQSFRITRHQEGQNWTSHEKQQKPTQRISKHLSNRDRSEKDAQVEQRIQKLVKEIENLLTMASSKKEVKYSEINYQSNFPNLFINDLRTQVRLENTIKCIKDKNEKVNEIVQELVSQTKDVFERTVFVPGIHKFQIAVKFDATLPTHQEQIRYIFNTEEVKEWKLKVKSREHHLNIEIGLLKSDDGTQITKSYKFTAHELKFIGKDEKTPFLLEEIVATGESTSPAVKDATNRESLDGISEDKLA